MFFKVFVHFSKSYIAFVLLLRYWFESHLICFYRTRYLFINIIMIVLFQNEFLAYRAFIFIFFMRFTNGIKSLYEQTQSKRVRGKRYDNNIISHASPAVLFKNTTIIYNIVQLWKLKSYNRSTHTHTHTV